MSELPDVDESKTTLSFAAPFRKAHISFNWGKGGGDLKNLKKKNRLIFGHRMYEQCRYRKSARDIYMNALSL
jgi:hypothetical protein